MKEDHEDLKSKTSWNAVDDASRRISYNMNSDPLTAKEAGAIADAVFAFNQEDYDAAMKVAYALIRRASEHGDKVTRLHDGIWQKGPNDLKANKTYARAFNSLAAKGYVCDFNPAQYVTTVRWD